MSEENIPQKVDPFRFAEHAIRLQGTLPVKKMQRLCESIYEDSGEIRVNIEFGKNEQDICFLTGQLSGTLQLQCQRCMEPLAFNVHNNLELAIVHTEEEAEKLPEGYDSIIANNDILIIQDTIEDELIVRLPLVPMHDHKDCKITLPLVIESDEAAQMEKENPFKVIELLRTKRDEK
jgi:DUF177 domain-containing protein